MFHSCFLALVMFLGPLGARAAGLEAAVPHDAPQTTATAATTQPAGGTAATTQPSEATTAKHPESITEVFGKTRFGQLFEGKQKVTLQDVRDPMFWLDTVKDLVITLLGFIPRIVVAFLFLVFFWGIYRMVRRLVIGSLSAANVDPSIRDMLGHLLKWSIMGFGIVIACNQIGIQIAALLTGVSIIGLAVGFAAQETLANFIAGIVIFWDKPFKVDDWVEIDGVYGQVQRVTFRSTRLLDKGGQVVVFPNTFMLASKLSNHTTYPQTRVRVDIGIAYKESIDAARAVLLGLIGDDERICKDPEPSVGVAACADSSVNLALFFWVEDESIERSMASEYLEKAKKAFDAANISIPFPHMQLFLEQSPAIEQLAGAGEPLPMRKAG